jgi:hypothetical protein
MELLKDKKDTWEQNQKVRWNNKRTVKEYPLIISDILRNKRISSKRAPR